MHEMKKKKRIFFFFYSARHNYAPYNLFAVIKWQNSTHKKSTKKTEQKRKRMQKKKWQQRGKKMYKRMCIESSSMKKYEEQSVKCHIINII